MRCAERFGIFNSQSPCCPKGQIKIGQGWWLVLRQTLPKKPVDGMRALAAAQDVERLRLAMAGAGESAFDWTIADDRYGTEPSSRSRRIPIPTNSHAAMRFVPG
jgi:hypothetical protein